MPGLDDDRDELVMRLKSALWYSIGNTVDAISLEDNVNASSHFIGALTELVWNQIATASRDMESFAKHASRRIIDVPDVMLLARHNEGLEDLMKKSIASKA